MSIGWECDLCGTVSAPNEEVRTEHYFFGEKVRVTVSINSAYKNDGHICRQCASFAVPIAVMNHHNKAVLGKK